MVTSNHQSEARRAKHATAKLVALLHHLGNNSPPTSGSGAPNRIQHHHQTMDQKSNAYYAIIKPSKESYSNLTHFHPDPLNITRTTTTGYTRDPMTQHAPSQIDGLCNSLCPATQVSGFLLMVLLRSLGAKQTETRNTAKEKLGKN